MLAQFGVPAQTGADGAGGNQPDGDPCGGGFLFHPAKFGEDVDAGFANGADESADEKGEGDVFPRLGFRGGLILHGLIEFTADVQCDHLSSKCVSVSGTHLLLRRKPDLCGKLIHDKGKS